MLLTTVAFGLFKCDNNGETLLTSTLSQTIAANTFGEQFISWEEKNFL